MVFFDPPYFLQLPKKRILRWKVKTVVEGVGDEWDHFSSFEDYDSLIERVLSQVKRIMKPNATIWCIGTYHNIFRIGNILQNLGFWILNDVIWLKSNPMPNWLGVRFTNGTETLIWAVKDKSIKDYTFNRAMARRYSQGKLAINLWKLPLCAGRERLKKPSGKKLHSAQKPQALLERIIAISTQPGDLVFDPMAGTGTTGAIARRLGRHYLLIEKEPEYVEAARLRLKGIEGPHPCLNKGTHLSLA